MPTKKTVVHHPCLSKWRGIVDRAEKRGRFTKKEQGMAGDWDACACGEAFAQGYPLGSFKSQSPNDLILRTLGRQFSVFVKDGHSFTKCRENLAAIENRLAELYPDGPQGGVER